MYMQGEGMSATARFLWALLKNSWLIASGAMAMAWGITKFAVTKYNEQEYLLRTVNMHETRFDKLDYRFDALEADRKANIKANNEFKLRISSQLSRIEGYVDGTREARK